MIYFDRTVLGVVSAEYPPNGENTRQQSQYLGEGKPINYLPLWGQHTQTFPQEVTFVSFCFEMSLALQFLALLEETVDCLSSLCRFPTSAACDPNIRFSGKPVLPSAIP